MPVALEPAPVDTKALSAGFLKAGPRDTRDRGETFPLDRLDHEL